MIYLKKACPEDLEKEWLFVRDMPEDENGLTNAWHNVSREDYPGNICFRKNVLLLRSFHAAFGLGQDDTHMGSHSSGML